MTNITRLYPNEQGQVKSQCIQFRLLLIKVDTTHKKSIDGVSINTHN